MKMSYFDLRDRVAVITGGASGIGLGIAHGLAEAGASIIICGRRRERIDSACEELTATHGVPTLGLSCDVTQAESVASMVDRAIERFGRIDILVNNAGVSGAAKPLIEMDLASWQETLDTNLTGAMLCSQAVARHMMRQSSGKIINIASVGAFTPLPHSSDYCSSKGGVLMLTRTTALELIKYNIHVNAICPGYFATDLIRGETTKVEAQASKRIPIGYVGDVRHLQGVAVLLASAASDYMVGSTIVVDGGAQLR